MELECPICNGILKRDFNLPMIAYRCWTCQRVWWKNNGKILSREEMENNIMKGGENAGIQ